MENYEKPVSAKRSTKGRKLLVVFGLLFVIAGVFLGSFVCSFQMMIQSNTAEEEGSLESQNNKLQEEVQLMSDQMVILENELEKYKARTTATPKPTSAPAAAKSTSNDND